MIETYFDRVDAASGYEPTPSRPISEDPRYWGGQLYATVIDRHVAEARDRLANAVSRTHAKHARELRLGIKLGHLGSLFQASGHRK